MDSSHLSLPITPSSPPHPPPFSPLSSSSSPLSPLPTENLWLGETLASLGLCPQGLPTSAPDFGGRRATAPRNLSGDGSRPSAAQPHAVSALPLGLPSCCHFQPRGQTQSSWDSHTDRVGQGWVPGTPRGLAAGTHTRPASSPTQVPAAADSLLSNSGRRAPPTSSSPFLPPYRWGRSVSFRWTEADPGLSLGPKDSEVCGGGRRMG